MGTRIPLSEVPYNNARRNGPPQNHPYEGRPRPQPPNGNENFSTMPKPSSIQSMLRNTTETGDVGQFSIKSSRVPTAVPRPSPASSSKVRNRSSKLRQPPPYYNGNDGYDGPHNYVLSRNGSGSSRHSQRPFRAPNQAPSFEDYHTFSMTQSSYTSHSLTHRHPYANADHYSRTDSQDIRPRSPFAYPTRLRRPGYRPSSPALSELSRSHIQRNPGLQRIPSSVAASQSVGYYPTRTPSPWQYGFNRSDPMLHPYPSSMGTGSIRNRSPSISSTRPTTPKPSSSLRSVASSSQLPRTQSVTNLGKLQALPQPPSPMFYDYTEGFDEQDEYTNMSVSTAILFEQSTPEATSHTQSEMDESPESANSAERPTGNSPTNKSFRHKDHNFDQGAPRIESVGGGWIRATGQDLSDVLEMSEKDGPSDQGEARSEDDQNDQHPEHSEHALRHSVASSIAETEREGPPYKNHGVQQPQPELVHSISAHKFSRASKGDSSPETGSMISARSSPRLEQKFTTPEPKDRFDVAIATDLGADTSAVEDGPGATTPIELQNAHPMESIRGPSIESHPRAELREILSPTPERSITSSITRDRFSRILSIDESLLELDHTGTPNRREERTDSPMQGPKSSSTIPARIERPWRKRSSCFRDNLIQPSPASKVLFEASDSEEEPELTSALRATFCKTDTQLSSHPEGSSVTTLPSQLSMRRPQTPLSIRRTPATTVLITDVPASRNTTPVTSKDRIEAPPQSLGQKVPYQELKRPTPVDKELPPLPKDRLSVVSYPPPAQASPSTLPFSFSPLLQKTRDDITIAELGAVTSSYLAQEERTIQSNEPQDTTRKAMALPKRRSTMSVLGAKSKGSPDRASAASSLRSRPWNLDTSYPWDDEIPELEVRLPQDGDESTESVDKFPRFKFRLQRASTLGGGVRRRSKRLSNDNTLNTFASSDIFPGPSIKRKQTPNLASFPTNVNSSHDILQSSLQRSRFVESFDDQSPTAKIMTPSPAREAQSFFSDDSSIPRPKGSLRKRFSGFRARTSRAVSIDQTRGYDRGLLNSAFGMSRASGRSSRQSIRTAAASSRASQARRTRLNVMGKLKLWLQPWEDRVRDWRWRMRYRRERTRAATSTPLYGGF